MDTSVLARGQRQSVDERLTPLVLRRELGICGVVELEMLYSARGHRELIASREQLRSLEVLPMEQTDFERAGQVMASLAERGKHRSVGVADLLVAACAERTKLTLLHYDSDYETIASVTGQTTEWIVPRGSVP